MATIIAFLRANWPWIKPAIIALAPVLVASLITRLTPYPKAKGFITFLQVLADLFSVLQHKDSQPRMVTSTAMFSAPKKAWLATWKLPFTRSRPPVGPSEPEVVN